MSKIIDVVKAIPKCRFNKKSNDQSIEQVEENLGVKFSEEYKDYLKEFGAVTFYGTELSGITENKYTNVEFLTKKMRDYYSNMPTEYYVIEDMLSDHAFVVSNKKGEIFIYANMKAKKINNSFCEFIEERIKEL